MGKLNHSLVLVPKNLLIRMAEPEDLYPGGNKKCFYRYQSSGGQTYLETRGRIVSVVTQQAADKMLAYSIIHVLVP